MRTSVKIQLKIIHKRTSLANTNQKLKKKKNKGRKKRTHKRNNQTNENEKKSCDI